jgi:hypothetical protein
MAEIEPSERRDDWLPGDPWALMLVGLAASLAAYVWVCVFDEEMTWLRLLLIATGLISAGGAVALRLNSPRRSYLDGLSLATRALVLWGLILGNAAIAGFSVVLVLAGLMQRGDGWSVSGMLVLAAIIAPVAAYLALVCFNRCKTHQPLEKKFEAAALLVLGAVCAFVCCWALYLGETRARSWDTIRLFLAVLAVVAMAGAGLVMLSSRARRVTISALVLFHFGGILTACMSAPPQPWVFSQIWGRIYRPYLQFMFLVNSYHFYAPEPGPASFLWFRVQYVNEHDPNDVLWSWIQFPRLSENGMPDYNFSVRYQRRLAMTDQVQFTDTNTPPPKKLNAQGVLVDNPVYVWRQVYSPTPPAEVLGKIPAPKKVVQIPYHPNLFPTAQYRVPTDYVKKLMESFAHHVYSKPYEKDPKYKPVRVKVYRVIHNIPTPELIASEIEPTSPVLYYPFYMGEFGNDAKGKFGLLDEPKYDDNGNLLSGDPLLYWLMPILPETNSLDAASISQGRIYGFVYLHAGDPNWVWHPGEYSPRPE